jgi:hypothetical protein
MVLTQLMIAIHACAIFTTTFQTAISWLWNCYYFIKDISLASGFRNTANAKLLLS